MSEKIIAIYVIGGKGGPLKIGLAGNPARRLRALQTGHDKPIALLYARDIDAEIASDIERRAHWLLREHHSHGEWFAVALDAAREAVDLAVANRGEGEKARPAVGRPPIKAGMKMVKQTVWLDPPLVARIIKAVGDRGMSEFMREAAETELRRRERAKPKTPSDAEP